MHDGAAVVGHDGIMLAAPGCQRLAGATREREPPQLGLGRVAAAGDVDKSRGLIDAHQGAVAEIGRRELADNRPARVAQLQLPESAPLRCPQELPAPLQPMGDVGLDKVDPCRVGLVKQRVHGARGRIGGEHALVLLAAILHDEGERGAGLAPFDAREVRVLFRVPGKPAGGPALPRDDPEAHARIGRAGMRIGVLERRSLGVKRIGDIPGFDGGLIGFLVGDRERVRGPPVAVEAVHLLLGDEFGGPVGKGRRGTRRECAARKGREVDDVELSAPHGRDEGAIRRKMRIDPVLAGQRRDLAVRAGDDVQLARERDEQPRAVL